MFRLPMTAALVCSLCFFAAGPSDLDACGGGASARAARRASRGVGLFGRRTTSFGYSSSTYYNATSSCPCQNALPPVSTSQVAAPVVQYSTVQTRAMRGGCPNGNCPINR